MTYLNAQKKLGTVQKIVVVIKYSLQEWETRGVVFLLA